MKESQAVRVGKTRKTLTLDWTEELERWIEPFLAALGHTAQRRWAPVYLRGLLGPGERKSVQPMAERVAPDDHEQLHHFIATSPWDPAPLETELARQAWALLGGDDAVLIVDDTALVKQGRHSPGVARQYCGQLGKRANCQSLVSLTLASAEVPVPVALRLYLPQEWTQDPARCAKAGIPEAAQPHRTKGQLALAELDRVRAAGAAAPTVLADAAYGMAGDFRAGLSQRGLTWAVGILPTQKVYLETVQLQQPRASTRGGRPRQHPRPSEDAHAARALIARRGRFRRLSWRTGTAGRLSARFAAVRVRPADGPTIAGGKRLPGEPCWLVCERRDGGEEKYYLTNHPPRTPRRELARAIKGRWVCEQAHQQLKEELGLDHFEGRRWLGLHHHVLMTMIAMAFLQHLRLKQARREKKIRRPSGTASATQPAGRASAAHRLAPPRTGMVLPAMPSVHSLLSA